MMNSLPRSVLNFWTAPLFLAILLCAHAHSQTREKRPPAITVDVEGELNPPGKQAGTLTFKPEGFSDRFPRVNIGALTLPQCSVSQDRGQPFMACAYSWRDVAKVSTTSCSHGIGDRANAVVCFLGITLTEKAGGNYMSYRTCCTEEAFSRLVSALKTYLPSSIKLE